jgi:hypothetical protein
MPFFGSILPPFAVNPASGDPAAVKQLRHVLTWERCHVSIF